MSASCPHCASQSPNHRHRTNPNHPNAVDTRKPGVHKPVQPRVKGAVIPAKGQPPTSEQD